MERYPYPNLIKILTLVIIGVTVVFLYFSSQIVFFKKNKILLLAASLFVIVTAITIRYSLRKEESLEKEKSRKPLEKWQPLKKSGLFHINIDVDVGKKEKHKVEFYYNKFFGNLHFKVDGKIVKKLAIDVYDTSLTKKYGLTVGDKELHYIQVKMERPLFFASYRRKGWKYTIYVDDNVRKTVTQ